MNILILGGSGNISYPYLQLAYSQHNHITAVIRNSGNPIRRKIDLPGVRIIEADIGASEVDLCDLGFKSDYDVVIDFLCFSETDAHKRIKYFLGKIKKYILISTTAGYKKQHPSLLYDESTPYTYLEWPYVERKFQAEKKFIDAFENNQFPVTIVRLGHTYDVNIPVAVGPVDWTIPSRILASKKIILHDNGEALWTLTHSNDIAEALQLIAKSEHGVGDVFNVVSGNAYKWKDITKFLFQALNKKEDLIYIPSVEISKFSPSLGAVITHHKMWEDRYNIAKLLKTFGNWTPKVTLEDGIKNTIDWYLSEMKRQKIDSISDNLIDKLIEEYARKKKYN